MLFLSCVIQFGPRGRGEAGLRADARCRRVLVSSAGARSLRRAQADLITYRRALCALICVYSIAKVATKSVWYVHLTSSSPVYIARQTVVLWPRP